MNAYKLTKLDVAALRKMDTMSIYRNVPTGTVYVYCTKELTREEKECDPFAREIDHHLPAPVSIRCADAYSWHGTDNERTKHAVCFAHLRVYREQVTHTGSILRLLRVDDEIAFEFRADWHSNGYVARARLHSDVLALLVYRDGKLVAEYELEHSTCEENSARMCKHVEPSKYWKKEAYGEQAAD